MKSSDDQRLSRGTQKRSDHQWNNYVLPRQQEYQRDRQKHGDQDERPQRGFAGSSAEVEIIDGHLLRLHAFFETDSD
jgi:hypothetical protein